MITLFFHWTTPYSCHKWTQHHYSESHTNMRVLKSFRSHTNQELPLLLACKSLRWPRTCTDPEKTNNKILQQIDGWLGKYQDIWTQKTKMSCEPWSCCTINAIIVCLPVLNLPCRAFAKIWQRNSKTIRKTWRVKLWTMTKLQTTEREIKQTYNCIYEILSILLPLCLPYCKSHCKVWPTNKSQPPLPKGRVHDTLPNTWFTQW